MYRSSYKNARRLAATETNMAYRTADYERWQQLDFIVGIRIQLSNNHTCLGKDGKPHPFYNICDELKGTYPKDFKFTGWHPHCRCIATTILKTDEEMAADDEAIMRGEQPSDPDESDNAVKELPDNFKQWMEDNEERIERAKSLPYFLRDNEKLISGTTMLSEEEKTLTPQKVKEKQNNDFSDEIKANNKELSEVLPVEQGKIMSFSEANAGKPNPDYKKKDGSVDNCQTCTMAYELRRRGFDVEALPNPVAKGYKKMREFDQLCSQQGVEWLDRWQTTEGKRAEYQWAREKQKSKKG